MYQKIQKEFERIKKNCFTLVKYISSSKKCNTKLIICLMRFRDDDG